MSRPGRMWLKVPALVGGLLLPHAAAKTHRYKLTPKGQLLTAALFAVRGATLSQLIGTAA
ncbi:MAG: hypothetical protein HY217_01695 [Candidatus Rokubacteria bacterium]|nr:hypothetical protein [Candidatus Rokubacteria bacterium]